MLSLRYDALRASLRASTISHTLPDLVNERGRGRFRGALPGDAPRPRLSVMGPEGRVASVPHCGLLGAGYRTRTDDLLFTRQLLYQLS